MQMTYCRQTLDLKVGLWEVIAIASDDEQTGS